MQVKKYTKLKKIESLLNYNIGSIVSLNGSGDIAFKVYGFLQKQELEPPKSFKISCGDALKSEMCFYIHNVTSIYEDINSGELSIYI